MANKIPLPLAALSAINGGATLKEIGDQLIQDVMDGRPEKEVYERYLKALRENYDSFSPEDKLIADEAIADFEKYIRENNLF